MMVLVFLLAVLQVLEQTQRVLKLEHYIVKALGQNGLMMLQQVHLLVLMAGEGIMQVLVLAEQGLKMVLLV